LGDEQAIEWIGVVVGERAHGEGMRDRHVQRGEAVPSQLCRKIGWRLQLAEHHADPFDRLLIAQARTDRLTLITRDPQIRRYDVTVLVA
jgi:PIN domain nuclease of toxin-antitoxin system